MAGRELSVQTCETDWNSGCHREWEKAVGKKRKEKHPYSQKKAPSCIGRSCTSTDCVNIASVLSPWHVQAIPLWLPMATLSPGQYNSQLCSLGNMLPLITVLTSYFTVGLRRDNAHRHCAMPQTLLRRTRCNAVLRRRKKISRKLIGLLDNLASTLHA